MRELFTVYAEQWGDPLDVSPDRQYDRYRIDRLVIPRAEAIRRGWDIGAIGIEVKASGHDLGRALAQAADYQRAIWESPNGFHFRLRWVFLFPCPHLAGPLAAMAVHSHVGFAHAGDGICFGRETLLVLGCYSRTPLRVDRDGQTVTAHIAPAAGIGIRRGSR